MQHHYKHMSLGQSSCETNKLSYVTKRICKYIIMLDRYIVFTYAR